MHVPIGKVKWYDAERGYGFVSNPGNEDCYVSKQVLPDGVEELHQGQRIDFDFAAGRRGPQALRVKILDTPRVSKKPQHKYEPEKLHGMVSDLVTLLKSSHSCGQGVTPTAKLATKSQKSSAPWPKN